jgi:DNA-binding response OmpR family regulator
MKQNILIVDDEVRFATMLSKRLALRGYGCDVVHDGESALDLLSRRIYKLIVLDLRLPGLSGKDVLERLNISHPDLPVIIMTGHGNDIDRDECLRLNAQAFLQKPVDISHLIRIYEEINGPEDETEG